MYNYHQVQTKLVTVTNQQLLRMRSGSLVAAEITVRVIVIILQIVALVGGGLVIELFPTNTDSAKSAVIGIGDVSIGVGSVVLFYEIIMIIFVLVEKVNHPARLLVDIILTTVMAVLSVLATMGAIALAVLLSLIFIGFSAVVRILLAIFALPIGLGVINSIAFIVSAISSGIIRSKLVSQARQGSSQPAPEGTTPTTFIMVPQQSNDTGSQSGYPPNYDSVVTAAGGPGIGEHQTVGSYPAVVPGEHYYDIPHLPQSQPQSRVTNKAVHVTTHPGHPY